MKDRAVSITITTGTLLKTLAVVVAVYVLFLLRELVLVVLTAIVIASGIEPAVAWARRMGLPRIAAVVIVYACIVGGLLGMIYFFVPLIVDEASSLLNHLPNYLDTMTISNPLTTHSTGSGATDLFSLRDALGSFRNSITQGSDGFIRVLSLMFGGFLSFVLIIVFSFYFAVQERGIEDFLRLVTPVQHEAYVLHLWKRSERKIGLWLQGQLLLGLIVGILTYLGLTILGVRYALLLAILIAILELIPLFGPILAAVPAIALSFTDGGASLALLTLGLYLIVQQFEAHLISPLVITKVVGVPPILSILALLIGSKLAGFLGIILAVPIAAILQELLSEVDRVRHTPGKTDLLDTDLLKDGAVDA